MTQNSWGGIMLVRSASLERWRNSKEEVLVACS